MELKEKVVLVTGSSRGIGAEIALAFARKGSTVVLNGRHQIPNDMISKIFDGVHLKLQYFLF